MDRLDLLAVADIIVDLETEARELGLPHSTRSILSDMRTKFIPQMAMKRERAR